LVGDEELPGAVLAPRARWNSEEAVADDAEASGWRGEVEVEVEAGATAGAEPAVDTEEIR
jgi:hypothetical protein